MLNRRSLVAGSSAALALPSAGRAQAARVVKFVPYVDLLNLDPVVSSAAVSRCHGYLVFDTLYGQTATASGAVCRPQIIAGHLVEDDGLTWTLRLRDGLVFHDGQPVLARDCVASIQRWAARDPLGQALLQRTHALVAADDRTIRFRLARPFPLLPYALGKIGGVMCAIMPEGLARTDPFRPVDEAVGSGPFRFRADERVAGVRAVYERFERYTARADDAAPDGTTGPKLAHFDRVEWHILPDAAAAAALQTAAIDIWEVPGVDLLPLLRRDRYLALHLVHETGFCQLLRPNHLYPPFDKPGVRRAVLGAVDQARFMMAAMGTDASLWKVPCGFFPPSSPYASEAELGALGAGPADARAAGYAHEKVVLIVAADVPILKAISDVAYETLRRMGMDVEYQAMDGATFVQRRALMRPPGQGGWSVFCAGPTGADLFDPGVHQPLRATGRSAWPGWPSSPRLEELRDAWLDASDRSGRERLAAAIQVQAFQDVPYVPLGVHYSPSAYRADLVGVLTGFPMFWNLRRA